MHPLGARQQMRVPTARNGPVCDFDRTVTPMVDVVFQLLVFFVLASGGRVAEQSLSTVLSAGNVSAAETAAAPKRVHRPLDSPGTQRGETANSAGVERPQIRRFLRAPRSASRTGRYGERKSCDPRRGRRRASGRRDPRLRFVPRGQIPFDQLRRVAGRSAGEGPKSKGRIKRRLGQALNLVRHLPTRGESLPAASAL